MKYIAYSIFGSDRRYFDGLLWCVELARELYQDWQVIVYADRALSADWLEQLRGLPVVLELREKTSLWAGLYWRFEVFDRADCYCAIIRDTDSLLTPREAKLVSAWEQSGCALHILRDHPDHQWPINAGMWGARNIFNFSMTDAIDRWVWKDAKFGDQHFLRCRVYRDHYHAALVHSSTIAYKGEKVEWIDPVDDFIGRVYFDKTLGREKTEQHVLPQPGSFRKLIWCFELLWRKFEAYFARAFRDR